MSNKPNCWGVCKETDRLYDELEVYKKAFYLLAEDSTNSILNEDKQELIDYYLDKAREEK